MRYKVLDLFCGCGGFSQGFKQSAFEIVAAIEHDKNIALTYSKNHKDTKLYVGDIKQIAPETVLNDIGMVDVIIGGPPCQGFSIAGKRDISDQRNTLPLEYIKYIDCFKPKVFVMENVSGILSLDSGAIFTYILDSLKNLGYTVQFKLLNSYDYEIPQLRQRVIVVGVRNDCSSTFTYPAPSNVKLCIEDVIGDIEQTGTYEEIGLYNHENTSVLDERLYGLLGEGKFLCDTRHGSEHVHSWEISLKGECSEREIKILNAVAENRRHKKYGPKDGNPLSVQTLLDLTGLTDIQEELDHLVEMKYLDRISDKYDIHDRKINMGMRIFDRRKPVNTITTLSGKNSAYAHYSQPRNFTVREVARLQTFPDDFIFYGSIQLQYRQVGNAVPCKLAFEIAKCINLTLNNW